VNDWFDTVEFFEREISRGVTPLEISLAITNARYAGGMLGFLPKTEYMQDEVRARIREKRDRIAKWILAVLLAPAAMSVNDIVSELTDKVGEGNWKRVVEVGQKAIDEGSRGVALDVMENEISDDMVEDIPPHSPEKISVEEIREELDTNADTLQSDSIDMRKIVQIESTWDPSAENKRSGARGLTQIMPKTWAEVTREMGVDWPWSTAFDPKRNLAVGTYYFNVIIPRYVRAFGLPDTVDIRLAAYNWGVGRVNRVYDPDDPEAWRRSLPAETRKYIRKYHAL